MKPNFGKGRIIKQTKKNDIQESHIFYGIISGIFRYYVRINAIVSDIIRYKPPLKRAPGFKVAENRVKNKNPAL